MQRFVKMARKIFVSYKHEDASVLPIDGDNTARAYVDALIELFDEDEIYKGEGDEDLSNFKDETIKSHLRDKIYDSSITIVLISPSMKDDDEEESEQWIPWEISYSLKEITRDGRTSRTNAVLAVVLPDENSSCSYFLEENTCSSCHRRTLHTWRLFEILRKNMFNVKKPTYTDCKCHSSDRPVYKGHPSYIDSVKWCDFIDDKEKYLQMAVDRKERIDEYTITKVVDE